MLSKNCATCGREINFNYYMRGLFNPSKKVFKKHLKYCSEECRNKAMKNNKRKKIAERRIVRESAFRWWL